MDDAPPEIPMATLAYATPEAAEPRWPTRLAWVALAVLWAGWACIGVVSAETVLVSAPALMVTALLLMVVSVRARRWSLILVAIGHIGLCVGLSGLVASMDLSPRRSVVPILMAGGVWATVATVMAVNYRRLGFLRIDRRADGVSVHLGFAPRP